MSIVRVSPDNVSALSDLAFAFTQEIPSVQIIPAQWVKSWEGLLKSGLGVIFASDDLSGALGMFVSPDINTGKLMATEAFWFVSKEKRGGTLGMRLIQEFEKEAVSRGCYRMGIAHMMESMPDKLHKFYTSRGYRPLEVYYHKEV